MKSKEPIEVGVLAQDTLRRLRQSAVKLTVEDNFKCRECKDIGLVKEGERWAQCKCKVEQIEEQKKEKGKFF